jgi:hypothetical protein
LGNTTLARIRASLRGRKQRKKGATAKWTAAAVAVAVRESLSFTGTGILRRAGVHVSFPENHTQHGRAFLVRGRTKKKSVFLLVAHRLFSTRARLTAAARATEPSRRAARVASRASSRAISRADHAAETRTPRSASSFRILASARHITLKKRKEKRFSCGGSAAPFYRTHTLLDVSTPFFGGSFFLRGDFPFSVFFRTGLDPPTSSPIAFPLRGLSSMPRS